MTLRVYSVAELMQGAKAIARGIAGIGTERSKDIELTIHTAARLLQGVQVGAQYVYEQLIPSTADATRRDEMAVELGLRFERDACPARGLIAVTYSLDTVGSFKLPAGHVLTFPGALFPDGQERSYRLLQDVIHGSYWLPATPLAVGSGVHKLLPQSVDGVVPYSARTLLVVTTDAGDAVSYAVVRTSNTDDQSLDLYTPVQSDADDTSGNEITGYVYTAVVEAECVETGAIGNAPRVYLELDDYATQNAVGVPTVTDVRAMIVEMSGGGDAQGPADGDQARQQRLIADTIACPPGHGNLQHWRELALSCPDVDLEDAVVYQHVRGPGTIDIVCIGRSGSLASSAFPDAHLGFVFGGNNQRVIGDVQAQRVQAWVQSQASYFDDVKVRSVEWDWRGNVYADNTLQSFVQSSSGLLVYTVPCDGYGPDCGELLDYIPPVNQRHQAQLHPTTGTVAASLQPGQRVWVAVGPRTGDHRHAFATVVATILTIDRGLAYVTIADVNELCPGLDALYGGELVAIRWGSAGPLTQPALDAVFAYYDQLGPGSYTESPRGPHYSRQFSVNATALPGSGVVRWPPEALRWSSSVRESELRARLLDIPGMKDAAVYALADNDLGAYLPDFEPAVFKTLALTGCIPKYGDF